MPDLVNRWHPFAKAQRPLIPLHRPAAIESQPKPGRHANNPKRRHKLKPNLESNRNLKHNLKRDLKLLHPPVQMLQLLVKRPRRSPLPSRRNQSSRWPMMREINLG